MSSYFNVTDLVDTITGMADLGPALTTMVIGFIGLIIVGLLIGFVSGIFDDVLGGLGGMFRLHKRN